MVTGHPGTIILLYWLAGLAYVSYFVFISKSEAEDLVVLRDLIFASTVAGVIGIALVAFIVIPLEIRRTIRWIAK